MSSAPDCPLCRSNRKLKTPVISNVAGGYLTEAYNFPGNYLIVPEEHVENPTELPMDWWAAMRTLIAVIPNLDQYNISLNFGKNAGQTISHLHFWIVPRVGGRPSSGKGLATLVKNADEA